MPDLSDTLRKCRIGTAKNFTLLLLLYHTQAKSAGLSQAELGDMLSVSHHTISAYEKEKSDPSDATKVWLARFFGVSVDYLMGLSDERYPGYAAASSDVLLLPEGLTEEQRSAVQDYALFLAERNG